MMRIQRAAFAAPIAGLLIVCLCAGTAVAFRIPGCPHKFEDAADHPRVALATGETHHEHMVGRALLQEAEGGGGGGGEEKPGGIAGWDPRVHGYTAGISFGIVMPFAAIVSRGFREYAPAWIWIHAPLGVAALIGGLLGVIWGAKLPDEEFDGSNLYDAHKAIGSIVLALAALQVIVGLLRPKPTHRRRFLFNHVHHWTGRLAVVLAIVNVYLGLHLADEKAKFFWGYAIVVGALILLWLAKEAIDFVRVKADNKRVDRGGFEASRLPGGVPMNGNFAPVFLQRRPKDAGLPIAGHGVRSKVADEQAALAAANANKGPPSASNGGATTGLLHPGTATSGAGLTNGYGSTTGHLHQGGAAPGGVEMARY